MCLIFHKPLGLWADKDLCTHEHTHAKPHISGALSLTPTFSNT